LAQIFHRLYSPTMARTETSFSPSEQPTCGKSLKLPFATSLFYDDAWR